VDSGVSVHAEGRQGLSCGILARMPDPSSQSVIEGTLEQIVFQSEDDSYTVLKLRRAEDGGLMSVTGSFGRLIPGEVLRVSGRWTEHPRYGPTFRAASYQQVSPANRTGIEKYLASGAIKGIGEVTARRLVEHFGAHTLEALDAEPARILEVKGISKKRAQQIAASWQGQSQLREVLVFLQGYGVSSGYAHKIYRLYKERTVEMVRQNPYRLAVDVRGIGFKKADAIAMHLGFPKDSPFRAEAAAAYSLTEAAAAGHTYFPRPLLVQQTADGLDLDPELLDQAVDRLAAVGRVVVEDDRVYLPHLFQAEYEIALHLRELSRGSGVEDPRLSGMIAEVETKLGLTLDGTQREAVLAVFAHRLVVITGGPGTGKTTLLNVLLRVHDRLGLTSLCASPTGRAAKRMAEATGHESSTIHRLLQYQPRTHEFFRNEDNPLVGELLVVDEASMLDTELFASLVKAIPRDSAFVLVGDVDQLPSVGPGSVLRDLIASGVFHVVRLTKIFRQAEESLIVTNAHRVNQGELPYAPADGGPRKDFFLAPATVPERALELVKTLVGERIPRVFGLDPLRDIQVLAPMYSGVVGVENLNHELQHLLNPSAPGISMGKMDYRKNDKVMQILNDYEKGVFNGDVGQVVDLDPEARTLNVDYSGRLVNYAQHELDSLVLAYAVSVHKSQGSEYPAVVMLLMNQHYVMLRRNLLYTGLTRARRLAVLVGQPTALRRAVESNPSARRYTTLAERLGSAALLPKDSDEALASVMPGAWIASRGGRADLIALETWESASGAEGVEFRPRGKPK
jgi:exodeoxyribonuclease V alpha subunit